jgi:hypothetical protein
MDPQSTFPFMQLPTEIRLMIYECIPVQIRRHDFNTISSGSTTSRSFTVVSKYIDPSILLTCRRVHDEATAIIQKRLHDILQTPPRWIMDLTCNANIHKCGGPLWHMSRYLAQRAVKAGKHLGLIPYLGTGMGASGARYSPGNDPQYATLARLTELWFRSLDYQQSSVTPNMHVRPKIEIALTASGDCSPNVALRALSQLSRTLFAEHGGFQFTLRKASHLYPVTTEDMRAQEAKAMVIGFDRRDSVIAVQGPAIEPEEFSRQWCDGSYY